MTSIVLDENVSLEVDYRLQALGHSVIAIAKLSDRGMSDEKVFSIVIEKESVLVTRDIHFTNPLRFPPEKSRGILYLTHGNLRASEEGDLVEQFFRSHPEESFRGHLVFLTLAGPVIR